MQESCLALVVRVVWRSLDEGRSLQVGQWEHQLPVKPVMQESCLALVVRVVWRSLDEGRSLRLGR